MRGLSLVAASGGYSSSRCAGLSLSRPLLLRSTGSRRAGSVIVAHGPSCSTACGIFPDQGSNPCPLHWQADSQPLRHQGSPNQPFLTREKLRDEERKGLTQPVSGSQTPFRTFWLKSEQTMSLFKSSVQVLVHCGASPVVGLPSLVPSYLAQSFGDSFFPSPRLLHVFPLPLPSFPLLFHPLPSQLFQLPTYCCK